MAVVIDSHKQAAKAALAVLVVQRRHVPDVAALGVAQAAYRMGLQTGDLDGQAMAKYAEGVQTNGEPVSNRRWASYPSDVQALAHRVADQAEREIDRAFA